MCVCLFTAYVERSFGCMSSHAGYLLVVLDGEVQGRYVHTYVLMYVCVFVVVLLPSFLFQAVKSATTTCVHYTHVCLYVCTLHRSSHIFMDMLYTSKCQVCACVHACVQVLEELGEVTGESQHKLDLVFEELLHRLHAKLSHVHPSFLDTSVTAKRRYMLMQLSPAACFLKVPFYFTQQRPCGTCIIVSCFISLYIGITASVCMQSIVCSSSCVLPLCTTLFGIRICSYAQHPFTYVRTYCTYSTLTHGVSYIWLMLKFAKINELRLK